MPQVPLHLSSFLALLIHSHAASFAGWIRLTLSCLFGHLDGQDHALLPYVGNVFVRSQFSGAFSHQLGQLAVVVPHIELRKQIQRRQRCAAGQRIAGIGMRMQKGFAGRMLGIERVVD